MMLCCRRAPQVNRNKGGSVGRARALCGGGGSARGEGEGGRRGYKAAARARAADNMLRRDSRDRAPLDKVPHGRGGGGARVAVHVLDAARQMAIERGASAEVAPTPAPAVPARPASPAPVAPAAPVRFITLNHGEHLDSTLYRCVPPPPPPPSPRGPRPTARCNNWCPRVCRFEKGTRVQFVPGPSLLGRKVFVYTNYVVPDSRECAPPRPAPDPAPAPRRPQLNACRVAVAEDEAAEVSEFLRVGPGGRQRLSVPALACHTVLAKCLGPLHRWEAVLRVSKEAGYNMIHFTPIQELGGSGSSYSLADQLRLNPAFGADASFADVSNLVGKLRGEWGVASICDVVLNHTANESPWLAEHPEATYNCGNCPRLRPAALLDAALARLTRDAARGHLLPRGIPDRLRLHELFTCDVPDLLQQFYNMARNKVPPVQSAGAAGDAGELSLRPDPLWRRLRASVDMERALQLYNVYHADCYDEETRLKRCCDHLRRRLEHLNAAARDDLDGHLRAAVDNCVAGMRYFRLQEDGPKIEEVSEKNPLVPRYFTGCGSAATAADAERLVYGEDGRFVMAHNGWVMDADPLLDFAAAGHVYLRRELIAWGDSVKLRYGARPEDSPWLWAHMREYVELTAELFDGLRLDNCHSTPLHVAEYLMDCARNIKPDLFVAAELFTNSDSVDNIFVNRLGISALIRGPYSEHAFSLGDVLSHDLGSRRHEICASRAMSPDSRLRH
ncbi:hypothetical protein MSG28_007227 [Choristoneura fumiferana]|uniref:Uncharacterized protein n=1 Tax=Choristoneura fumiferana TaxID=7141 RepID=A0ACC0JWN5_CHOFU|nr:hypothetical protein MSG28_007227 [Choristoneura fumiferana]